MSVEIVAENPRRVFSLDAGHGLFNVVLNVVREVESDTGELH
jgi:hypothetical protein